MGSTSPSNDPLKLSVQSSLSSLPSLNMREGSSVSNHHQCISTLKGHSSYVSALVTHGNSLYSGSADQHIQIWTSLESNHTAITCKSPVKSLLISGHTMFSSHQDAKIRIWHIKQDQPCSLQAVLPTAKDRILSLLSPDKYVQVRRHKKCTWVQHVDAVSALAVSSDQTFLYSVSWDRTIKVWLLSGLKCVESVPRAHHDAINAIVVSEDGFVYTGSADKTIRIWKKCMYQKKHVLIDTLERHRSGVNALALSGDGSVLYSGASDRAIVVWEQKDGRRLATGAIRGHTGAVLCLSVTEDLVCSGSADRTVRMWRRGAEGEGGSGCYYSCLAVFEGHGGPVKSLAMWRTYEVCEDDGCTSCLVYSGSLDCEIKVWKLLVPSSEREMHDDGRLYQVV